MLAGVNDRIAVSDYQLCHVTQTQALEPGIAVSILHSGVSRLQVVYLIMFEG